MCAAGVSEGHCRPPFFQNCVLNFLLWLQVQTEGAKDLQAAFATSAAEVKDREEKLQALEAEVQHRAAALEQQSQQLKAEAERFQTEAVLLQDKVRTKEELWGERAERDEANEE